MFSNLTILYPSHIDSLDVIIDYIVRNITYINPKRWKSAHIIIFLICFGIYLLTLVLTTMISNLIGFCMKVLKEYNKNYKDEIVSDDFFKAVPFLTLYYEYRSSKKELFEYEKALKSKSIPQEDLSVVQRYMERINSRIDSIKQRINDFYFKKYNINY
jgi:hypothetical protein